MAQKFKINKGRVLNSALFVLNKLGGSSDFHKLFKILYFAEQKHLAKYGRPISGDIYIAMKHGPVPSNLYDVLKSIGGISIFGNIFQEMAALFEVRNGSIVSAKKEAELDDLAKSNLECLNESIEENRTLSFDQLSEKSHDSAWDAAPLSDEMNFIDIAIGGGADADMVKYIRLNLENQNSLNYANFR